MKDLQQLISQLRLLSEQARETADQLERVQSMQDVDLRLTLTVEEAATALGVNPSTVYDYARQNQIPHVRIGKRLIISRAALMNWLNGATAQPGRDQAS